MYLQRRMQTLLLKDCPHNCSMDLQNGAQPLFGPIFNLLQNELPLVKVYIDKYIVKHFIEHSKSSATVLIFFLSRKNKRLLQTYIDY